ncbi:MAG: InlB B-repeat-containing protein [Clostridia bacterium]|nr:InlB B-repeat-containing protein [Clostridia bacterium]
MKRTNLRRFLPVLLTLLTVIIFAIGITATAVESEDEATRSNQITHANLVLDNDVDLVFWADVSEEDAQNKDTFMLFNDSVSVSYSGTKTLNGVTYAIYKYSNILPKDLPDIVNAKLYVNGAFASYLDYSVKDYCQYILTHSKDDNLKTLVSDLLVYGAESQALANESEEELVTNGIVGLTPSETPDKMTVLFEKNEADDLSRGPSASLTDSKLLLNNGIELYFNVDLPKDADISDYTVCLSVNGREQEMPITSKVTLDGYENRVSFKGVYSYELFDVIQVNVYKNNIRVSNSTSFSVAAYIDTLNKNPEYAAVTAAYYNYCYSSHVFAGTHTIVMPGELATDGRGSDRYDDSGTITYKCSLCGHVVSAITVSNSRDFNGPHSSGSVANSGKYTIVGEDGKEISGTSTFFEIQTNRETLEDGTDNGYLSITRDNEKNLASGSLGYYMLAGHARPTVTSEYTDHKAQFKGTQFTFSFDIKSPESGIVPVSVHIRNTQAPSSSSGRFGEIITIDENGSLKRASAKIAPEGTVNADKWTNVTITMDFFTDNGADFIYLEYYIDNVLVSSFSVANTMMNGKFTDIHISMGTSGAENGQGILLDNMILAQGCVHNFSGDIKTHLNNLGTGNLRGIIDKVQNEFNTEDFSYVVRWDGKSSYTYREYQSFVTLDRNKYKDPLNTPKSFDHPRVLFNSNDVPKIVANIEAEENAKAKSAFLALVTENTDGKLTPTSEITPAAFEWTNYNSRVLRVIEAKALYYALYKDSASVSPEEARMRGYEAIYAMKNYLLTFDTQWKASDQCRYYGEMMYYSALVYDWCYDLLTDDDKDQFRLGVQNLACDGTNNMPWAKREGATGSQNGVALNTHEARKLEGGFPALAKENQSRLTGHGAEAQVIRDYFAFAIAIFDEDSSWYDYVGGLIYQDYIDAREYFYTANFYPDGSAGYNEYRFLCDMYNAWLFKGMGVEFPYNEENMASVVHGLLSMETYDGFMFATGDGAGTAWNGTDQYRLPDNLGDVALISSHLFDDPAALAIAHHIMDYRWGNGNFSTSQLATSAAYYLILTSNGLTPSDDYRENIDNVEYHAAFQQQVISRDGYGEDSVVVLMQGGQHLPGGHTHQNAGNFQIWYKGMLTRDDGLYDAYGSDHHHYYHAAAVAHNTLLIYNNNLKNSPVEPVGRSGFYNGGQRAYFNLPATYSAWIKDSKFSYGQNIGMQTDDATNPSYVYFANDITNAYEDITVDYVERSFMTLYTGDEETPMVMFVFDNITADSPEFKKTFLLQCATEPIVDKENGVVTIDNGEGKLVLTSLLGGDQFKAYGRTSINGEVGPGIDGKGSERFWLSGQNKNLAPGGATSIGDKSNDLSLIWGHVEISANTGNATDQLVNVLYVTDSGNTVSATPTLVQGDYLSGATFKNSTSVFLTDSMHSSDILSFTVDPQDAVEEMTYYIGGLSEGHWKVYINDERIYAGQDEEGKDLDFEVTADGKLLTFKGAVGTVRIEPGEDMRPAGAFGIAFNLNGAKWPEGTEIPKYYIPGEAITLPVPEKVGSDFGGWFTTKDFSGEPITKIPEDATGIYRLYAKWSSPILYVDYTMGGDLSNFSQVTYSVEAGGGTTWDMVNTEKESYFLWKNTGPGSIIGKNGGYAQFADLSLQVSFSISLGRNGSDPLMPVSIYIRDQKSDTLKYYLNIFMTDASGNAYIGQGGGKVKIGEIASSGSSTFHFVLDFKSGNVLAYDNNGNQIAKAGMATLGINRPIAYSSYEAWFRSMESSANSMMSLKGGGAGTIRVYGIKILSGNLIESCKNFDANSNMHKWDEGVVVREPSSTDCTPGTMVYTCADCEITREVALTSNISHSSMSHDLNSGGKLQYTCETCGCSFVPGASYFLTGADYNGLVGVGNATHYTTKSGTNQPVINAGAYELINKTGKSGNLELWVPGRTPSVGGFSSENNAKGFVSFKVNAFTTDSFGFNFVDTSSSATKWSSGWCITDSFFRISAPTTVGNKTTVKVTGWDSTELATIELKSEKSFTDWIDVQIYIELDAATDKIILHYYIGGAYKCSVSRDLTTDTNAINSICISGTTSEKGSGIKLDDIAFGFTPNGEWALPKE